MILKEVVKRLVSILLTVSLIKQVYLEFRLENLKNCLQIFEESRKYSKKQKFEKSFDVSTQKLFHILFGEILSDLVIGNSFERLEKTIFKQHITMD